MQILRLSATALLLLVSVLAPPAASQFSFEPGGFSFGDPANAGPPADPSSLVELSARFAPAGESLPAMIEVTAQIEEGYHIYSLTQPAGGPQPSALRVDGAEGVRVTGPWVADPGPKTHVDELVWVGLTIEEHDNTVTWRAPIELPVGVDPAKLTVTGFADMQACTESACYAVDGKTFTAKLVEAGDISGPPLTTNTVNQDGKAKTLSGPSAEPAEPVSLGSLLPILGAAMLGGLILNLMPCVLPVIGLKVLSFAEQAGHHRGKVLAMNLAYSAGLMSVFLLLAALAAFAGYGWGELYTHAEFKIGMVVLVFAMALSFLGVWEIPLPGFAGGKSANHLQQQEGFSGAFFKGVFTTVLATPCSGPFLFPVFSATIAAPPYVTFLIFGFVGLGMASPYLLIGLFPDLVKVLPKPGAWMETFKQLMGFILLGTAVYLFGLVSEEYRFAVLASLVGVGFACWWIGRTPITASPSTRATAWIGGMATAVVVGLGTQYLVSPSDHELAWREFTPAALATAKAEGKTVLVDFTADWCPTCQVNSRVAINTEDVKRVVEANGVTPLLADWSDKSDTIEQTLASLGSRSIPFLAIFPADRPEQPILLPDLITEEQLLEALAQAGAVEANTAAGAMPEFEIGEVADSGTLR